MSPAPQFEVEAELPGHMKVKLFYQTREPRHVRSQVLQVEMQMTPPFVEDVSVLLPAKDVFNNLAAYEETFQALQSVGLVGPEDRLRNFEIRDEDVRTLAYYRVPDQKAAVQA